MLTEATEFEKTVLDSIECWMHMYAWLSYEQIRRGISAETLPPSAKGKRPILAALAKLESKGYVQSKGKVWGFTPQYDAFLRGLKALGRGAR